MIALIATIAMISMSAMIAMIARKIANQGNNSWQEEFCTMVLAMRIWQRLWQQLWHEILYHDNNCDEDEEEEDDEDCRMALSCSLCNLCVSSRFPEEKNWHQCKFFTSGKPCCKNCKICGETTEGCSWHDAATIVTRRLRASVKVHCLENSSRPNIKGTCVWLQECDINTPMKDFYLCSLNTFQLCDLFQSVFLFHSRYPVEAWNECPNHLLSQIKLF